jgi:hypothetical protein
MDMIIVLCIIGYLMVGFFIWGVATAMTHGETWFENLILGLFWPAYSLVVLGLTTVWPLRERLTRGIVSDEIRELKIENDRLQRENEYLSGEVDRYLADYDPKPETVARWREEWKRDIFHIPENKP